jgi:DNA-directed RNA polymerase II subunit RPB2
MPCAARSSVSLGRLPIMVRSRYCMLSQQQHQGASSSHDECRYDYGGYFIINGSEKVIISQVGPRVA